MSSPFSVRWYCQLSPNTGTLITVPSIWCTLPHIYRTSGEAPRPPPISLGSTGYADGRAHGLMCRTSWDHAHTVSGNKCTLSHLAVQPPSPVKRQELQRLHDGSYAVALGVGGLNCLSTFIVRHNVIFQMCWITFVCRKDQVVNGSNSILKLFWRHHAEYRMIDNCILKISISCMIPRNRRTYSTKVLAGWVRILRVGIYRSCLQRVNNRTPVLRTNYLGFD